VRSIFFPNKTYAPLVINANAVLALTITLKQLQLVTRRNAQAGQFGYRMQLQQLSSRHPLDALESARGVALEKRLGV